MLGAIFAIFSCLLVGNFLNRVTGVPIPGPVLGMLLLLAFLVAKGNCSEPIRQIGNGLLRNMSVLFVPAGVGLITQLPALERDGLPIGIAILVSTALGMVTTAAIMHLLAEKGRG